MIEKITISRDDTIYEAWPDVALLPDGRLLCVFTECTHHGDRSYTRIMLTDSDDRGRTWTPKRPLTEGTQGLPFWNSARISTLRDGRIGVVVDKIFKFEGSAAPEHCRNYLFFSHDGGATWGVPMETPAFGIVPDKLLELADDRWILSCHYEDKEFGSHVQRLWYSDDRGESWSVPVQFPLPACHRPVAGFLRDGRILITYRFMQGGKGWTGWWTQNFFAALTDRESALAPTRNEARTRILPIDFDRSPASDTGYSGWVQFEDGEIYIVNYIVDDAPKGQIRGYALRPEDFLLS